MLKNIFFILMLTLLTSCQVSRYRHVQTETKDEIKLTTIEFLVNDSKAGLVVILPDGAELGLDGTSTYPDPNSVKLLLKLAELGLLIVP